MNYKESWFDLKNWIENGIGHLSNLSQEASTKERIRLLSKKEGFQVILQYMLESERMYKLNEDQLDQKLKQMTNEQFIEFFNQIDDKKTVESLLKAFEN